jgi:L-rhamnose mutarotase
MAGLEVNVRWQSQMETFFVQPQGLLPDAAITPLEEVFHV